MLNYLSNRIRSIVSRKLNPVRRKLEYYSNAYWYDWPFGQEPRASKEEYLRLAKEISKLTYPKIDEYEQRLIEAEMRVADFKRKYSDILE